jgi:hypothetical protein
MLGIQYIPPDIIYNFLSFPQNSFIYVFLIVIEHLATIFLIQDPSIGLYSNDSLHILQFWKKKFYIRFG